MTTTTPTTPDLGHPKLQATVDPPPGQYRWRLGHPPLLLTCNTCGEPCQDWLDLRAHFNTRHLRVVRV